MQLHFSPVLVLASLFGSTTCLTDDQARRFIVGQKVDTSSGPVKGHSAHLAPEVSEYLGIPYAVPPTEHLRFAPPQRYKGNQLIDASKFSVSCPATPQPIPHLPKNRTVNGYHFARNAYAILSSEGQVDDKFGEDCLTVNVWTKPQKGETKKAVMLWIYGGGFITGNSDNNGTNGAFLADSHDVVIVSFNYRINIFGFPGDPTGTNNLGLLDQRLAVEWVRDNIEVFGGDPERITLFGESAGGISVDYYTYAWRDDPIINGFIVQSGTVFSFAQATPEQSAASWFNVSSILGCGDEKHDPSKVLQCMRTKSINDILTAVQKSGTLMLAGLSGNFGPTVDEKVVFSNYQERARKGQLIKKPLLIGNNDYESGLLKALAAMLPNLAKTPDYFWKVFQQIIFECPTAHRAYYSHKSGVSTWRYRYFGDFPNLRLTIKPPSRAYHGAEIPMVFNTLQGLGASTPAQKAFGHYIRVAWTSFAKDSENGLKRNMGWEPYVPAAATLLRLAYNNTIGPNYGATAEYDYLCPILGAVIGNNGVKSSALSADVVTVYQTLEKLTRADVEVLLRMYQT